MSFFFLPGWTCMPGSCRRDPTPPGLLPPPIALWCKTVIYRDNMLTTFRTGLPARGYSFLRNYHRPALWLVLACLFGLDIITTTISLDLGFFEKNPLMIPFAANPLLHGMVKIGAYLLLFGVIEQAVLFIREKQPDNEPFFIRLHYRGLYGVILLALFSLAGFYAVVLAHNLRVIAAAAGMG